MNVSKWVTADKTDEELVTDEEPVEAFRESKQDERSDSRKGAITCGVLLIILAGLITFDALQWNVQTIVQQDLQTARFTLSAILLVAGIICIKR